MNDFKANFQKAIEERLSKDGKMHISKTDKEDVWNEFIWIETNDKQIGHLDCHYELICKDQPKFGHSKNHIHVEAHFENDKSYFHFERLKNIDGVEVIMSKIDKHGEQIEWEHIGLRINKTGHCIDNISMEDLVNEVVEELYKLDEIVGTEIRDIINTEGICNDKD
ncbi:MAG: hypothetical protein II815_07150 [Bacteroidales bacterium]|nr:hypothetical protein [Bacteroidales bacterium]